MTGRQMWELVRERHPGAGETHTMILLNNALTEFHKKTATLWKTVELSPDSVTAIADLPTDLIAIRGLFYDPSTDPTSEFADAVKGHKRVYKLGTRQEEISESVTTPIYFRIAKRKVKVGTTGSDGTITPLGEGVVTLEYSYWEAPITIAQTPELDSTYHEAIVYRVCEGMYRGQEQVGDRTYCFARWKEAIREARADANVEDDDEEWNVRLHEI